MALAPLLALRLPLDLCRSMSLSPRARACLRTVLLWQRGSSERRVVDNSFQKSRLAKCADLLLVLTCFIRSSSAVSSLFGVRDSRKFEDTSRMFTYVLSNFRGLIFGCIETDFWKSILFLIRGQRLDLLACPAPQPPSAASQRSTRSTTARRGAISKIGKI